MDVESCCAREPRALPLYRAVEARLLTVYPTARVDVQRSQITFRVRRTPVPGQPPGRKRPLGRERPLATLWLPIHPVAGRPEVYLVLTFGLRRCLDDPRIVEAVETYPGRWTHHLLIARVEDVDEQVLAWLDEACAGATRVRGDSAVEGSNHG